MYAGLALALGIALSRLCWITPAWLLSTGILPCAVLSVVFRRQRGAWLPLLATWLLSGLFAVEVQPHADPQTDLLRLADGSAHQVEGEIVRYSAPKTIDSLRPFSSEVAQELQLSLDLRVDRVDGAPVHGGMRVSLYTPAELTLAPVRCGDILEVTSILKIPQRYRDPGVWDSRAWLLSQGIAVIGAADARRTLLPIHAHHGDLSCHVHSAQLAIATRLTRLAEAQRPSWLPPWAALQSRDAAMLIAMVTGDRSYLERGERVGFEETGTFHVLVVSGLHIGLIAVMVMAAGTRMRLPRVATASVTAIVCLCYAVFTGFGAPVERSLWMILLYLAARTIFRERHPLQAVGIAAICLLTMDPGSLFDAGLQMTLLTVIATGGLVAPWLERTIGPYHHATHRLPLVALDPALAPRLAQFRVDLRLLAEHLAPLLPFHSSLRQTSEWLSRLVRFLFSVAELLVLSATVELVMALPMAVYFHRATILALPTNLLLVPMLTLLLPAAIVTAVVASIQLSAAKFPAIALAALLHLAGKIVQIFSRMEASETRVATPEGLFLALTLALLALTVWAMRQSRTIAVSAFGAFTGATVAMLCLHPWHQAPVLAISALDVGQGDSIFLRTPDGKTLLVDAGGPTGGEVATHGNFEIGEDVVSPALWSRGVQHLDVVSLSHAHSDHMGGMFAVLRNFRPRELWVGNNPPTESYRALLAEAASLHITVRSFRAGDTFEYGGMDVRVLAPAAGYVPAAIAKNDDSLVLLVAYRNTSALLEGDAEAPSEASMAQLPSIHADLLKVGHHGSRTSTTPQFLAAVAPRYAVVSVGLHNLYHHPRFETLMKLEDARVITYRTDLDGMSTFYLDGKQVSAVR